jgi:hypothetical protein
MCECQTLKFVPLVQTVLTNFQIVAKLQLLTLGQMPAIDDIAIRIDGMGEEIRVDNSEPELQEIEDQTMVMTTVSHSQCDFEVI